MSALLRSLARSRELAFVLAGGAFILALAGQSQFARGPSNVRAGILFFLLAIAFFLIADWLHAERVAAVDDRPGIGEAVEIRPRKQRRQADDVDDPWLKP